MEIFLRLIFFHAAIGCIAMLTIHSLLRRDSKAGISLGKVFIRYFIYYFLVAISVDFFWGTLSASPRFSKILSILMGHLVLFTRYKALLKK